MILYTEIGQQVREFRENKKWTQQELADKVKLTRTSITNIEAGNQKIPVHVLYGLAIALDVPLTKLLPPLTVHEAEFIEDPNEEMEQDALNFMNKIKLKRNEGEI